MKRVVRLGATLCAALPLLLVAGHPPAGTLPYQSRDRTEGTAACASTVCHGSLTPWKESRVLQNEYVTWTRQDKHTQTYSVLQGEQSRKIAHNLGLEKPAAESAVCLDCHTDNVPAQRRGDRFLISDGVTCEACHGPAARWIASHVRPDATREQKLADGLYPLADPGSRARLCLSCHGGNADRFVTHRMMSAGHPRISFELETFSMIEPAHFALSRSEHPQAKQWNGARIWATGQAVAVSEAMALLLNPARNHDGPFPELVLFDCNGCHHPMSDKRSKPQLAFGGKPPPGIVRLDDANLLMLQVIARQIDPALGERVSHGASALQAAVAGTGDLETAALEMKETAEEVELRVQSVSFSPTLMTALARAIVEEGAAGHYLDYAEGEQAFMSIGSLVDFMNRCGSLKDPEAANKALARLGESLQSDESWQAADFRSRLGELGKQIL